LNIHVFYYRTRTDNNNNRMHLMASLTERLEAAAFALAGQGAIKDRLADAYINHLADLEVRDFPRELRDEFAEFVEAMHRERALPGDSVIKASLRKLSNADASRYATLIVRSYGRVAAIRTNTTLQILPRANAPLAKFLASEVTGGSR
jgi:hypothetical protein